MAKLIRDYLGRALSPGAYERRSQQVKSMMENSIWVKGQGVKEKDKHSNSIKECVCGGGGGLNGSTCRRNGFRREIIIKVRQNTKERGRTV